MDTNSLDRIIKAGIKTEAEVVYFLSEIRLLMERERTKNYPVVKFYSDWSMHAKKNNIQDLYKYFEEIERLLNSVPIITIVGHKLTRHIEELTSFKKLKSELKILLEYYKIDGSFIDSEKKWGIFCDNLLQVISRKPIYFENLKTTIDRHKLSPAPIPRKPTLFLIDYPDKKYIPTFIQGALYWALFINTSEVPISGVVKFPKNQKPIIIDTKAGLAISITPRKERRNIMKSIKAWFKKYVKET